MKTPRRSIAYRIPVGIAVVTLLALFAFVMVSMNSLKATYHRRISGDLLVRARLVRVEIEDLLEKERLDDLRAMTVRMGKLSGTRVTIVAPDGTVLGDSDEDPAELENHRDRPEISRALAGEEAWSIRFSPTLKKNMMYAAVPVFRGERTAGVARTALSLSEVEDAVAAIQQRVIAGGAIVTVLSAFFLYLYMRRLMKPLRAIVSGAEAFARGELSHRIPVESGDEFGELAEAMTRMAKELDARIRTILRQRNEQEAVLTSMIEGVIAVDPDERVMNMNTAAARFFGVVEDHVIGRSVQEVVRNTAFQRFVARTLSSGAPVEDVLTIHSDGERTFQVHGTVMRDAEGNNLGAVLVMNDVTRLHRLETVRRDFVANVSHELKTPVTSIKGYVETLIDGAAEDPEARARFLAVIAKETDRLHWIIEDLLSLSRLEQEQGRESMLFDRERLAGILEAAVCAYQEQAAEKSVTIRWDCDETLSLKCSPHLLEQAFRNLIDNAVKYTRAGTTVAVEAVREGSEAVIRVSDEGCGIPAEHLPRVFERFYRVDPSRDRKTGSTGLGLSIVKHIVHIHGGMVTVESTPGVGSVFTVRLPAA
ncbi:MAG: ATP-binding protein [Bacteroidota bacterium]|nr:ATP-binding protein [Bacteroidota bacterium]